MCVYYFLLLLLSDLKKNYKIQLTVGQCLKAGLVHQILQQSFCLQNCGKKEQPSSLRIPPLCSVDRFTYTQTHKAHGNELAKRVTQKNNANLCSSHCGSTGNNKDGYFLCGEYKLGIMFGVSSDLKQL